MTEVNTTNTATPAEATEAELAAAKAAIGDKVAQFGGKPADAWATVQAAWVAWPEKDTELVAARKVLDNLVGVFEDLADAWAVCKLALKKPAAARKVPTGRTADGGLTASRTATLAGYVAQAMKFLTYVSDVLEGKEPTPLRNRAKSEDAVEEPSDDNVGIINPDDDDIDAEDDAGDAATEVAGLDSKSAAALGVRTAPRTAQELAALAAPAKSKPKK